MSQRKSDRSGSVAIAESKVIAKNAKLTIMNSWFAGLEIILKKKRVTLGRNVGCDICLDDSLVSDEHASITRTENGFQIEDLNSRNGLMLNGKEVHQKKLLSGDVIEIGNFKLRFTYKTAPGGTR